MSQVTRHNSKKKKKKPALCFSLRRMKEKRLTFFFFLNMRCYLNLGSDSCTFHAQPHPNVSCGSIPIVHGEFFYHFHLNFGLRIQTKVGRSLHLAQISHLGTSVSVYSLALLLTYIAKFSLAYLIRNPI
jgi:hypothetical protein